MGICTQSIVADAASILSQLFCQIDLTHIPADDCIVVALVLHEKLLKSKFVYLMPEKGNGASPMNHSTPMATMTTRAEIIKP